MPTDIIPLSIQNQELSVFGQNDSGSTKPTINLLLASRRRKMSSFIESKVRSEPEGSNCVKTTVASIASVSEKEHGWSDAALLLLERR